MSKEENRTKRIDRIEKSYKTTHRDGHCSNLQPLTMCFGTFREMKGYWNENHTTNKQNNITNNTHYAEWYAAVLTYG